MGWTNPVTWTAGFKPTAAWLNAQIKDNLAFLKNGVAGVTNVTANVGPTSGTTELTLATSPAITFDGSTLIEVMFSWYNVSQTVNTDQFFVRLYDGGTQIAQWFLPPGTSAGSGCVRAVLTPSAGSHTYTARLVRSSGTGTATMSASATIPAPLSVRQVN